MVVSTNPRNYIRELLLLFSCSVVSDCLQPHGLQQARLPCPSQSPRVCPNSFPLSWWCYPTISSSVIPFSSCLQSFPASGSFLTSQLFVSGGQSIRASASVLPMNIQGCFPLGVTGLILSARLSSLLQHHSSKASILWCSAYYFILNYIQICLNHTEYLMMNFPIIFM